MGLNLPWNPRGTIQQFEKSVFITQEGNGRYCNDLEFRKKEFLDDFLNKDSSKSSIEESDNLSSDVSLSAFLVGEDSFSC